MLKHSEGGKVPAFTTMAEYEGGVLDIIVEGSDPPKHLKLGKRFLIRSGEKLPGFTQLLRDRATFVSDMLKNVGESFAGRARVWEEKDHEHEEVMDGDEEGEYSDDEF